MDFHNRLRQETRDHHNHIEGAHLLKAIIDGDISRSDYQLLIEKFYGYIRPCEQQIQHQPWHALLTGREKSPLLAADLLALGHQQTTLSHIHACQCLPALTEREHALGYLYVIEGSTLGGQIISKRLHETLQLKPETGSRYFTGYGKATKARWDDYCDLLNQVTDREQQNKIINAVNLTYTTLYDWMVDVSYMENAL